MRTERGASRRIDEQAEANRQTASLAGLAMALFLVVLGLFLVQSLRTKARLEDCLLAGRRDCTIIVSAR